MDLQHHFRHWPEAHDVVGDILRRTWENFRGSAMVSQRQPCPRGPQSTRARGGDGKGVTCHALVQSWFSV